ncbi:MAG: glycosyltransferase family 39 protein [Phycisphaerales bacterium]|nr:glycosyltransferase family 39 protein [Phycisphaerales bacterium]
MRLPTLMQRQSKKNDGNAIAVLDADYADGAQRWTPLGRRPVLFGSVGLILVTVALSYRGLGDWCSFSPDGITYLTIARTLAENGHLPQERLVPPPAYPVIIAPLLLLGDLPLLGLRILFLVCWMMTAVMTYLLHRRELGDGLGWVAGLLVASNPVLLMLTTTPLSESVFIAALSANLVLMHTWWQRPVCRRSEVVLGGLLTTITLMIRSMGIVMLPLMGYCLLRHRKQALGQRAQWAALFALCTLGPILAWNLRQSAYPAGHNYASIWVTARGIENTEATGWALQFQRFITFGPMRLQSIKEAVLQKDVAWRLFRSPLDTPSTWVVGGFFVVIALGRFLRFRTPTDAFVLATLLMLSLWPWDEGVRLVAPLLPVLVAYPLWLGKAWWHQIRQPRRRFALAATLVLILVCQGAGITRVQSRLPVYRDKAMKRVAEMINMAEWHASNAPDGAKWIGVTPKGHNDSLLLMGSAYLSRRPLNNVNLKPQQDYELTFSGEEDYALVHKSVYDERGDQWTFLLPNRTVGRFVVLTNSYLTGMKPEED